MGWQKKLVNAKERRNTLRPILKRIPNPGYDPK